MIKLELPLPPSKNRKYLPNKGGGYRLSPAVKTFRKEVWYAVKNARHPKIYDPCRITVTVHPRDNQKIDQHNFTEQLYDALQYAGLVENDRQFTDCHCRLGPIVEGGKCVVEIFRIT